MSIYIYNISAHCFYIRPNYSWLSYSHANREGGGIRFLHLWGNVISCTLPFIFSVDMLQSVK